MKENFTAGVYREFYGQGDFFRLLETTYEVTVEFFQQSRQVATAEGVQAGYAEYFKERNFDRVRITSALTQDVKFVIRDGSDVRYDRGAAQISGSVDLNAATLLALETTELGATTLAALESVDLNAATIAKLQNIKDIPSASSGSFHANAALAQNTPETVIPPSSNTNGAILLFASWTGVNSASNICGISLLAKASAPGSNVDGEVFGTSDFLSVAAGTSTEGGSIQEPQYIAAGLGLYYIAAQATSAGCPRTVRYKLL